jgi:hypothetical protein
MHPNKGVYEYVAEYVDNLLIAANETTSIIKALEEQHRFKLKVTGPLKYSLGWVYFLDDNGTLCVGHRNNIEKMIDHYAGMFESKYKECTSPLEEGNHPEINMLIELDLDNVKVYQSMIGFYSVVSHWDVLTPIPLPWPIYIHDGGRKRTLTHCHIATLPHCHID